MTAELGIRATRKLLTTRELTLAGFELFAQQGYDATTVEQIADRVGISKRTFFRYFANKEDLVLGDLDHTAALLVDALGRRPLTEQPWRSLRRSFDFFVEACDKDARRVHNAMRILETSPDLKTAQLGKLETWRSALVPELSRRLAAQGDGDLMHAAAMAGAAVACLDAALNAWYTDLGARDLGPMLDSAMGSVAPIH